MPTDAAEPPDALARLIVRVADEHAAQEARIAETTGYARVAQLGTGVGLLGVLQGLVSAYLVLHGVPEANAHPVNDELRNVIVERCRRIVGGGAAPAPVEE